MWAEADGVLVNSERNLTLGAKAVDPPGEALADLEIIARVACEMGYGDAFAYAVRPPEVFDGSAVVEPRTGYDVVAPATRRCARTPLQWP